MRFASGTGGGVWVKAHPTAGFPYLELGLDLPAGAHVTAVTYYFRNCDNNPPKSYFGAYTLGAGGFTYFIPEFDAPTTADCSSPQATTQPVSPAVEVDNVQARYVIGYRASVQYGTDTYLPVFVKALLVGARVTYELPGAFLPTIQR